MNVTLRKWALLEKEFNEKEEQDKILGCIINPANEEIQRSVAQLMDRVRAI